MSRPRRAVLPTTLAALTAVAALSASGCGRAQSHTPATPDVTVTAAPIAASDTAQTNTTTAPAPDAAGQHAAGHELAMAHHAGHLPPIDCPLAKAGVDPNGLKPFEEIDAYIAFLERPDRAAWQRPDAIVEAIDLAGNETVADLGAGSGYFTFRFAAALPEGKVRAIDVEPEMIRHIHHKAMTSGITNIEAVLTGPDDPKITATDDVVFICDVLHHVPDRPAWLKGIHDAMKPGARLVVVEFKEGDLPQGPPAALKLSRAKLIALATGAGFTLSQDKPDLLPYQHLLIFRR